MVDANSTVKRAIPYYYYSKEITGIINKYFLVMPHSAFTVPGYMVPLATKGLNIRRSAYQERRNDMSG